MVRQDERLIQSTQLLHGRRMERVFASVYIGRRRWVTHSGDFGLKELGGKQGVVSEDYTRGISISMMFPKQSGLQRSMVTHRECPR